MKDNPDRFVRVEWRKASGGGDAAGGQYEAVMRIFAENRISMLADITSALAEMRVSILQINTQTKSDGQCIISIGVACKNLDHYLSIVSRIKNINGVYSIERGYTS